MSDDEKPSWQWRKEMWDLQGNYNEALKREKNLLQRLTWTPTKPTAPGWYWWRFSTDSPERTTEVRYVSERMIMTRTTLGEWAGPLEPPKEPS